METNAILSKFNELTPGLILERSRIGRSGPAALWIDSRNLRTIARGLAADGELRLDWLENLSIAQIGTALVATYFLRSTATQSLLMIRCTVEIGPEADPRKVDLPSIRDIWPMARTMEDQWAELFGLRFLDDSGAALERPAGLLPEGLQSASGIFPMRKAAEGAGATEVKE